MTAKAKYAIVFLDKQTWAQLDEDGAVIGLVVSVGLSFPLRSRRVLKLVASCPTLRFKGTGAVLSDFPREAGRTETRGRLLEANLAGLGAGVKAGLSGASAVQLADPSSSFRPDPSGEGVRCEIRSNKLLARVARPTFAVHLDLEPVPAACVADADVIRVEAAARCGLFGRCSAGAELRLAELARGGAARLRLEGLAAQVLRELLLCRITPFEAWSRVKALPPSACTTAIRGAASRANAALRKRARAAAVKQKAVRQTPRRRRSGARPGARHGR